MRRQPNQAEADNFLTAVMKYHCNADGDLELHLVSLKRSGKLW